MQQAVAWVDRFVHPPGRLARAPGSAMLVAVTCSLTLAIGAVAQTAGTGTAVSSPSASAPATGIDGPEAGLPSPADRQFLEKAAMAGMAEVELGKLAQQKATSIPVRVYGERMVRDHGEANEELQLTASAKGSQVPAGLDPKHKATLQRLQNLSSREFDLEYMKQMVADHQQAVSDFRKQAESGEDADLKRFAASRLPQLEEHLKTARSLSEATKAWKR
jgi:putative membrane protein